jgi:cellulose synthase/poly-beta-1,6-N-acetylglucosamine synthase-like glycosyltransferase
VILDLAFAAVGAVLALFSLYLVAIVVAALFYRRGAVSQPEPHSRLAVVVPAHDERDQIGQTVESLLRQTYPRELYDVVVIADNCADDTADVAAAAGADVLVRDEPEARGKGQALAWAFDQVVTRPSPPDAVVVVDADSIADDAFLSVLATHFESGAEAVQGESLLSGDGSAEQTLRVAAFLLVNRARPSGRAVLGLPASLQGNGMLFSRQLLLDHPWSAFSSTEDVEYSTALRSAGVRPAFARGAIVTSAAAPRGRVADEQQLRWEGGKLHVARKRTPRLLADAIRGRRGDLFDTAFEIAVPPLGYLAAAAASVTVVGAALVVFDGLDAWAVLPAALALVAIPIYVVMGFRAADAPPAAYASLARAPSLVVRKLLNAYRLLRFRADSWVRTERPGD